MSSRILTISGISQYNNKEKPLIRLQGKWLERLGFFAHGEVVVEEKYGKLTVEPVQIEKSVTIISSNKMRKTKPSM